MPNLSQRLKIATKEALEAKRRRIAAEKQTMYAMLDLVADDDDEPPPLPKATPPPAPKKGSQPKK